MKTLITQAVDILREGGFVAFPTETVYGLGADARNEAAIRKLFHVKQRPLQHPLIVHLADIEQLPEWTRDIPDDAMVLAKAFWPGPLTMILKKQKSVSFLVTGGQESIGLRIPRHPIALALLRELGSGIAAPSANKFTHLSPTTAAAVREEFGQEIDLVLDGGVCEIGIESSIIDMTRAPVLLRPGMITQAMISEVLGKKIESFVSEEAPRVPGSHPLHYAPQTKTSLIHTHQISDFLRALHANQLPIAVLYSCETSYPAMSDVLMVQMPSDASAYAHELYQTLRRLDHQQFKQIVIETVPDTMAWDAIRDRLMKASGGDFIH